VEEIAEVLEDPDNSFWVAFEGGQAMSYLRFEGQSFGACNIVRDESTMAITGAYTRPEFRGRGLAPALLDAALSDYRARGFLRCSVDFESFNPEAAAFWMRYFQPVCYSLFRVPEKYKY
jgi:ribosomal protein S18 acetylase RimI-like enzyme